MRHKLDPPYRFLIDECLGMNAVPSALEGALLDGEAVYRFTDVFERGAKDEVWLRKAGAEGYVIITKDDRLRYRPNERAAIIEARLAVFGVASGTGQVMAQRLVLAMPTMRRILRGQKLPLFGRVLENGGIALSIVAGKEIRKTIKRPIGG